MQFITIACVVIGALVVSAEQTELYRVTHTYALGGDGSWDYIVPDPPSHRLFIGRQNRVMVVDEDTGALLGEVVGIAGAHGTAIAPASGHGFATSGNDQSVVMFDLNTYKALSRIPAAEDADAIIYDPASNRVFTFNGDAHSSTVISPQTGSVITNIPLGGKPEYGASAGDGKVYANLTDTSEVVEIDAKVATVARRWSTAPCKQPVAMAIDTAHHRLFSGCRSGVMAISDYQSGTMVATVPIGAGVDGAGYDPATADAFATNADGTLTVIHQDSPDQYPSRAIAPDATRVAQHGTRSHGSPHLRSVGEVRPCAGGREGTRPGSARLVRRARGRAFDSSLIQVRSGAAVRGAVVLRCVIFLGRRPHTRPSRRHQPVTPCSWAVSVTRPPFADSRGWRHT